MPRLVLFDIDGTILSAGRSGLKALEQAVIEVLQAPRGLDGISLSGNTDRNVLLEISRRDGSPLPDEETIQRFVLRYAEVLRREIMGTGSLMPGIEAILRRLSELPHVLIGLVTGNFEVGAEIKLDRFGLRHFFQVGAFGGEHHDRGELVGMAIKRAEAKLAGSIRPEHITMIGDTPNDVKACKPWNIRSLAVATGSHPVNELESAGATWVLPSLEASDEVLERLLG
ncbi:MAG TPA: HAD hydrolase-like protein [Candidatus Ozemobacteraceae bacterium]|nr:HAD hydrolase-like protein [Candidatus Ozemobacteraceae bacterium]